MNEVFFFYLILLFISVSSLSIWCWCVFFSFFSFFFSREVMKHVWSFKRAAYVSYHAYRLIWPWAEILECFFLKKKKELFFFFSFSLLILFILYIFFSLFYFSSCSAILYLIGTTRHRRRRKYLRYEISIFSQYLLYSTTGFGFSEMGGRDPDKVVVSCILLL